jgi:N-carbamoyl-L-amino-acid hydrolase
VPARASVWFDARAESREEVVCWRDGLEEFGAELEAGTGVEVGLAVEADSAGVEFDARVRGALAGALDPPGPEVVCFAGHDAGILAERIPAGMVLVRNESGISHAPEEEVSLEDAAVGAEAMVQALEALA